MLEENIKKLKLGAAISTPILLFGVIILIIGYYISFMIELLGLGIMLWGFLVFFIYLSKTWVKDVTDETYHKVNRDPTKELNHQVNKVLKSIEEEN